eukprot:scaffold93971_cov46-Prasinocladus_malaysianus.AAC.1
MTATRSSARKSRRAAARRNASALAPSTPSKRDMKAKTHQSKPKSSDAGLPDGSDPSNPVRVYADGTSTVTTRTTHATLHR